MAPQATTTLTCTAATLATSKAVAITTEATIMVPANATTMTLVAGAIAPSETTAPDWLAVRTERPGVSATTRRATMTCQGYWT